MENGYVTLFKGNIRLNIGKYGKLEPAKEPLTVEVNTENNVSSKTYEQEADHSEAADEADSEAAEEDEAEEATAVAAADTETEATEAATDAVAAADTDPDTKCLKVKKTNLTFFAFLVFYFHFYT